MPSEQVADYSRIDMDSSLKAPEISAQKSWSTNHLCVAGNHGSLGQYEGYLYWVPRVLRTP
jgi:hypothetical protein